MRAIRLQRSTECSKTSESKLGRRKPPQLLFKAWDAVFTPLLPQLGLEGGSERSEC